MFVTHGHTKTIVGVLFTVIITFGTCKAEGEKQPDDYHNSRHSNGYCSYITYHFDSRDRYDQLKLTPEYYFMSCYNPEYQTLPDPNDQAFDYQEYQQRMKNRKNSFDMNFIIRSVNSEKKWEQKEKNPRYVYENSEHFWKTDEMYYGSKIFEKQKEIAEKYYNLWYTLEEDEFNFVQVYYQLFKTPYENESEFINARVQVVLLLQDTTPNIQKKFSLSDMDKGGELPEVLNTRVYLKNEDYTNYFMRLILLNGIPFPANVLYSIYGLPELKEKKVKFSVPMDKSGEPVI